MYSCCVRDDPVYGAQRKQTSHPSKAKHFFVGKSPSLVWKLKWTTHIIMYFFVSKSFLILTMWCQLHDSFAFCFMQRISFLVLSYDIVHAFLGLALIYFLASTCSVLLLCTDAFVVFISSCPSLFHFYYA